MAEIRCPHCGQTFELTNNEYQDIVNQVSNIEIHNALERQRKLDEQKTQNEVDRIKLEKEKEITKLQKDLDQKDSEKEDAVNAAREEERNKAAQIQREFDDYKSYRSSLNVKLNGENLEQHCKNEFEKVRAMAFKNAYFGKDNEVVGGTKGDFIFRDYDVDGTEIVSIMFDMKNQDEASTTKHKNEDFLAKLDKDRNEKGCEYAVLVSMLEEDSDLYNTGIVDVSYKYPKMYVVRPQFFIQIISIIRNAALNSVEARKEAALVKKENIDVSNFQENLTAFYDDFNRVFRLASDRHNEALDLIDKMIDLLKRMRSSLNLSNKHLVEAKNKIVTETSIKSLTKNAPSVAEQFAMIDLKIPDFDKPLPKDENSEQDYGDTSFLDHKFEK